jgi:hypothetical protein
VAGARSIKQTGEMAFFLWDAVREVFDLGENTVSRTLAAINDNHRLSLHRKPPFCPSPINVNLHSNAHLHSLRKVFVCRTEPVGGRVWCEDAR